MNPHDIFSSYIWSPDYVTSNEIPDCSLLKRNDVEHPQVP